MQTFSQALIALVLSDQIDREVAANAATNRHDFMVALEHELKRRTADERAEQEAAERAAKQDKVDAFPELRVARPAGQ
jgi:hypothetical protein